MKQGNPRAPLARHGTPDFSMRVTELYRDGSIAEAEKAERDGRVPVIKPAVPIGSLTAGILRRCKP
jgi:hypothetical protein